MIRHWRGEETSKLIELVLEYAPEPPNACGRPELADAATLAQARADRADDAGGAGAGGGAAAWFRGGLNRLPAPGRRRALASGPAVAASAMPPSI